MQNYQIRECENGFIIEITEISSRCAGQQWIAKDITEVGSVLKKIYAEAKGKHTTGDNFAKAT